MITPESLSIFNAKHYTSVQYMLYNLRTILGFLCNMNKKLQTIPVFPFHTFVFIHIVQTFNTKWTF